ncbi:MAG TPA: hypothetical protein VGY48_15675 [Vicinamibacterales bacterium]|nr:hypothetical protein [Vicinamibacterales bacterium]
MYREVNAAGKSAGSAAGELENRPSSLRVSVHRGALAGTSGAPREEKLLTG